MKKKYFLARQYKLDQFYKDYVFKFDNLSEVSILEINKRFRTIQAHT